MSTNHQNYLIEDMRQKKSKFATFAVFLAFFIVCVIMHVSFFLAFIGGIALAVLVRGVGVVIPGPDPTIKWKAWGRPFALTASIAVVFAVLAFLAVNDSASATVPSLIAFGVPCVVAAFLAAKSRGLIGGGGSGF